MDDRVWKQLLTAELNEAYYRVRADRLDWLDTALRVGAAALATGAVVTWARGLDGALAGVWTVLTLATAATSAAGPILRLSDRSRRWADLAGKWTVLAGELRVLSLGDTATAEARAALVNIAKRGEALQRDDTTSPRRRLIDELQAQILKRHGVAS
jgi:hypothetical protein